MDNFMQDYLSIKNDMKDYHYILQERRSQLDRLDTALVNTTSRTKVARIVDELERLQYEYAVLENAMRRKI